MDDAPANIISEIHAIRYWMLDGHAREALGQLASFSDVDDSATVRIVRGECHYILRDFTKAQEDFRHAMQLAPNSPRAEILFQLATEMVDLEKSMRPPPRLESFVQEREVFGLGLGSHHHAPPSIRGIGKEVIAPAEQLHPDEIGLVSETLAGIMVGQGKFEEARKVYIQLSRLNPNRYEYFRARMDELDQKIAA